MILQAASMFQSHAGQESPIDKFKRLATADGATVSPYTEEEFYSLSKLTREGAALTVVPGAYKTSVVYGMKTDGSLLNIPFTRSGTATRINASGVMEVVSSNVPRLQFDRTTLKPKGYLLEPAATNYHTNSDGTTGWGVVGNITISAVAGSLVPSGNAVKLLPTAISGQHGTFKNMNSIFPAVGSVVSISLFVKAAGYGGLLVIFRDRDSTQTPQSRAANINLTTGTVVASNMQAGETMSMEDYGNGWYRLKFENWQTSALNVSNATHELYPCPANMLDGVLNAKIYTGDGVSAVLFTGYQIEVGSKCTSYIPTTASQVTRVADSIVLDGLQLAGLIGYQQGTVIFKGTAAGSVLTAIDAFATTLYNFLTTELHNVPEAVHTSDGQSITTKGGWRWKINGKDTFAHQGTVYENPVATVNGYSVNKLTAPNSPLLLNALALFNTAISNADMSTITT